MKMTVEQFRALAAERRDAAKAGGARYTKVERAWAVGWAAQAGLSRTRAARELNIADPALRYWQAEAKSRGAFECVHVSPDDARAAPSAAIEPAGFVAAHRAGTRARPARFAHGRRAAPSAGVIGSTRAVRVLAYTAPVDMRKSYNGLEGLVRNEMGHDLLRGDLFLFMGKDRRRAKVLLFDGTGLCIHMKRLTQCQFAKLRCSDGELRMTVSELALFLEVCELAGRSDEFGHTLGFEHEDRGMAIMMSTDGEGRCCGPRAVAPHPTDAEGGRVNYPGISSNFGEVAASAFRYVGSDNVDLTTPTGTTTLCPGASYTFSWSAANRDSAAVNYNVRFYLSTDRSITTSDILLGSNTGASFGGPGFSTFSKTVTIPSNATRGATYFVGEIVDWDSRIPEWDESNNATYFGRRIRICP